MKRYIDAELLKADIRPFAEYESNLNNKDWVRRVEVVIDNQPTADVVEVVRCKDCRHKPNGYIDDDVLRYPNFPHEESNPCPCKVYGDEWYSWIPNDDFYCGFGERT